MAKGTFIKKKSGNPFLSEKSLREATAASQKGALIQKSSSLMTVEGAVNKSLILTVILLSTAVIGFSMPSQMFLLGGALGGLAVVILATFKQQWSPTLAPMYAALEGLFVGSVSAIYASAFDGIVLNAATLTIAILFLMLMLYKSGVIKVTQKFRSGVILATGAIFVVYLMSWILSFFGITIPYLHQGGTIGIGISLLIVGVASLNLLLDFDNFDRGERAGAPKYYEWYSAMGLLITLVWLYIELLRLLSYFSSND